MNEQPYFIDHLGFQIKLDGFQRLSRPLFLPYFSLKYDAGLVQLTFHGLPTELIGLDITGQTSQMTSLVYQQDNHELLEPHTKPQEGDAKTVMNV